MVDAVEDKVGGNFDRGGRFDGNGTLDFDNFGYCCCCCDKSSAWSTSSSTSTTVSWSLSISSSGCCPSSMGTAGSLGGVTGSDAAVRARSAARREARLDERALSCDCCSCGLTPARLFRAARRRASADSGRCSRSRSAARVAAVRRSSEKVTVRDTGGRKRLCWPSGW